MTNQQVASDTASYFKKKKSDLRQVRLFYMKKLLIINVATF